MSTRSSTVIALALAASLGACTSDSTTQTGTAASFVVSESSTVLVSGIAVPRADVLPISAAISFAGRDIEDGDGLTALLGLVDAVAIGTVQEVTVNSSAVPVELVEALNLRVSDGASTKDLTLDVSWQVFLDENGETVNAASGALPSAGDEVLLLLTETDPGVFVPFNMASRLTETDGGLRSSAPGSRVANVLRAEDFGSVLKASSSADVQALRELRAQGAAAEAAGRAPISEEVTLHDGTESGGFDFVSYESRDGICYAYQRSGPQSFQCIIPDDLEEWDVQYFASSSYVGGIVGEAVNTVIVEYPDAEQPVAVAVSEAAVGNRTLRYFVVSAESADQASRAVVVADDVGRREILNVVVVGDLKYDFVYSERMSVPVDCYGFGKSGAEVPGVCSSTDGLMAEIERSGGVVQRVVDGGVSVGICQCTSVRLSGGRLDGSDVKTEAFPQDSRAAAAGLRYVIVADDVLMVVAE